MGVNSAAFYSASMETAAFLVPQPFVCLIDSDPAVRDSVRGLASLYGQTVRCYATARAFLDEVDRLSVRCVVCEARLPDMRGVDVYLALRERGLGFPFALLVSRDFVQAKAEASAAGIGLVVPKPILDVESLIDFIALRCQLLAENRQ